MKQVENFFWVEVYNENTINELEGKEIGKWMVFFSPPISEELKRIAYHAINEGVVRALKYSNIGEDFPTGVLCLYSDLNDNEEHRRIISFMLSHNLIKKTKDGKFNNISFKLDRQTKMGIYNKNYNPILTLDEFIDLSTGDFLPA